MHRIIYFFILLIFLIYPLNAKEPVMAILDGVVANGIQKFTFAQYSFYCKPYGVLTLEMLYENDSFNSGCQESLQSFYKKNPLSEHFSGDILKVKQMYHVDFRDNRCILYARGEKTLAELLLKEGLAVTKPLFNDDEFVYVYNKVQLGAKITKKGIWADTTVIKCINALYKEK